jgi:hypothetical protein
MKSSSNARPKWFGPTLAATTLAACVGTYVFASSQFDERARQPAPDILISLDERSLEQRLIEDVLAADLARITGQTPPDPQAQPEPLAPYPESGKSPDAPATQAAHRFTPSPSVTGDTAAYITLLGQYAELYEAGLNEERYLLDDLAQKLRGHPGDYAFLLQLAMIHQHTSGQETNPIVNLSAILANFHALPVRKEFAAPSHQTYIDVLTYLDDRGIRLSDPLRQREH